MSGLAQSARRWSLALTARESVAGTEGERAFGPWLAGELRADPAFAEAEIWTHPVAPGDPRHCVLMLLRGNGPRTVILTGHYDTVGVDDYGPLRPLATDPAALLPALAASLAEQVAPTPAMLRAQADLASGDFLPGRGLLDMKAGLAAGLAVCESVRGGEGNILFLAVPDEENNSAGARAIAPVLEAFAQARGLDLVTAVNLDAIADDGDGSAGRAIALGTVGKLLATAFVVGTPTHGGFPLAGLNAGALAAALAARLEWAAELTDEADNRPGMPPSVLSLRDGKAVYDVTTPATAFLSLNVLSFRRTPGEVLARFDALCAEAAAAHCEALRARAGTRAPALPPVPVLRYGEVEAACLARSPAHGEELRALGEELDRSALSLPERCRIKTERAWALSGLSGPAIVSGFGSIPYLPTNLSRSPYARALSDAAHRLAERHEGTLSLSPYFAGISDMSFFGEADTGDIATVSANTPLWRESVRWPEANGVAGIPTVNLGPWGRDYHTPLERLHVPYAFDTLPRLIAELLAELGVGKPA